MDAGKIWLWAAWAWVWLWAINQAVTSGGSIEALWGSISWLIWSVKDAVLSLVNQIQEFIPGENISLWELWENIWVEDIGDLALGWMWWLAAMFYYLWSRWNYDLIRSVWKSTIIASIFAASLPLFWAWIATWWAKTFYDGLQKAQPQGAPAH